MSFSEDEPERCAESCIFEAFGDALDPGTTAAVGMGVHRPATRPSAVDWIRFG